jgi:hypothetical protein
MNDFIPPFLKKRTVRYSLVLTGTLILLIALINLGAGANLIVMGVNGNKMPVLVNPDTTHDPATYTTHKGAKLAWLGDIFSMHIAENSPTMSERAYYRAIDLLTGDDGPGQYYFSLGDVFLWISGNLLPILAIGFAVLTAILARRAHQHGHHFFAGFRHQPDTSRMVCWLIDSTIVLALLAIAVSITYDNWIA